MLTLEGDYPRPLSDVTVRAMALYAVVRLKPARLLLPTVHYRRFITDGSLRELLICYIEIEWNEEPRTVEVLVTEGRPLLGMVLMDGSYIGIDARSGGEAVIEPQ